MTFQESEVVALFFGVTGLFVMVYVAKAMSFPGRRLFVGGYIALVCAYIATVLEGVFWEAFFNPAEHVAYTLAASLMLAGTVKLGKRPAGREDAS